MHALQITGRKKFTAGECYANHVSAYICRSFVLQRQKLQICAGHLCRTERAIQNMYKLSAFNGSAVHNMYLYKSFALHSKLSQTCANHLPSTATQSTSSVEHVPSTEREAIQNEYKYIHRSCTAAKIFEKVYRCYCCNNLFVVY